MKIREFCKERNVTRNTVNMYMSRHPELLEKIDRSIINFELDDYVFKVLDSQYPLPNKIEVVNDSELQRQLIQTQKELIEAQKQITILSQQLSQTQLLEYKLQEKEDSYNELQIAYNDVSKLNELNKKENELLFSNNNKLEKENKRLEIITDGYVNELLKYKKTIFGFYKKRK